MPAEDNPKSIDELRRKKTNLLELKFQLEKKPFSQERDSELELLKKEVRKINYQIDSLQKNKSKPSFTRRPWI